MPSWFNNMKLQFVLNSLSYRHRPPVLLISPAAASLLALFSFFRSDSSCRAHFSPHHTPWLLLTRTRAAYSCPPHASFSACKHRRIFTCRLPRVHWRILNLSALIADATASPLNRYQSINKWIPTNARRCLCTCPIIVSSMISSGEWVSDPEKQPA